MLYHKSHTEKFEYVSQDNKISDVFADFEKVLCIIPEYYVEENIVDTVEEDIDVNLHELISIDPIFLLIDAISKHRSRS